MWARVRRLPARLFSTAPFRSSVNGVPTDPRSLLVSAWDISFQRGDGVFEAFQLLPGSNRCWLRGRDLHLARLQRSANALDFKLPDLTQLSGWLEEAAKHSNPSAPGLLRLICTRGSQQASGVHFGVDAPPQTFITWEPKANPAFKRLSPEVAPWHPAGFRAQMDSPTEWETIKWLSYAPNLLSTRKAVQKGFDDALLLDRAGDVLDGPRFGVCWIGRDGVFYTPCWKQKGLLQSVSVTLMLQAARALKLPVNEGCFKLQHLLEAKEVMVCSAGMDAVPVKLVGKHEFPVDGEVTKKLRTALAEICKGFIG